MSPTCHITDASDRPLYERIRYQPELETRAFERLAVLDVAGCRTAFARLLARLDLSAVVDCEREVSDLLLDVLQKINRRIHGDPQQDDAYQAERIRLIEELADCRGAPALRQGFARALERLLATLSQTRDTRHPVVQRACAFVEQNYRRRICLSTIAERLHVSPNYLSRLFPRETGRTLTAYIQHRRVEHARRLLGDEGRSLAEIGYQVGYQTYRDFYRNFVKLEGLAPGEARRQLRATTADRFLRRPDATGSIAGRQFWSSSEPSA